MNYKLHRFLYRNLVSSSDIKRLQKTTGCAEELLRIIYTQKTVRATIQKFYKVKAKTNELVKKWLEGEAIVELAKKLSFPPVLIAYFILTKQGYSRKQIWRWLKQPETAASKRLRNELKDVSKLDIVYSPAAISEQKQRGRLYEQKLKKWLDKNHLLYYTERELRKKYSKTPDFLLKTPISIGDLDIKWIESKATFGDELEIRKDMTNQLRHYAKMFGAGIVVYWFGKIDKKFRFKKVIVVDADFFR